MGDATRDVENFANLVERLVPSFAELLATLASRDPLRMYFAGIGTQTLLDITDRLLRDKIPRAAIAPAWDITVEGFRAKLKRALEDYQEAPAGERLRPRTWIERVYAFVAEEDEAGREVSRAHLELTFHQRLGLSLDTLTSVLKLLCDAGLLSVSGRGTRRIYRLVPGSQPKGAGLFDVLMLLHREGPLSVEELSRRLRLTSGAAAELLEQIAERQTLEEVTDADGTVRYSTHACHIEFGDPEGFSAGLYDHFHSVCRALGKKIRLGRFEASPDDLVGGSTYTFEVPPGSPVHGEILAFLKRCNEQLAQWREATAQFEGNPDGETLDRVTIYVGQMVERVTPPAETAE